jgi:hypothetical protein
VRWTAPTGREYLDHAAQEISTAASADAGPTAPETVAGRGPDEPDGEPGSTFADEPPF